MEIIDHQISGIDVGEKSQVSGIDRLQQDQREASPN